jgi:hypothetical protein
MSFQAPPLRRPALALALLAIAACADHSTERVTGAETGPAFSSGPKGTWVVTTLDDPGAGVCNSQSCTLRQAIAVAASGDRIVFKTPLSGPIVLAAGELQIDQDLTIQGEGRITLDANGAGRVIVIGADRTVTLDGLTITGGNLVLGTPSPNGGGIFALENVNLTVRNSTIAGNEALFGGGIVFNNGTLTVINSTVRDNRSRDGGGIYNVAGVALIIGSTIADNEAGPLPDAQGGGLFNFGSTAFHGTMTVIRSTISGNRAVRGGGGIFNGRDAVLAVHHSTVTANHAGAGGGLQNGGTSELANSIMAGNTVSDSAILGFDCFVAGGLFIKFGSAGHNLTGHGLCTTNAAFSTDIVLADPAEIFGILDSTLSANGGHTLTHALIDGGRAIDAGNCPDQSIDQRGLPRPFDHKTVADVADGCDIGAVEWLPRDGSSTR